MPGQTIDRGARGHPWRILGWGAAASVLLVPAVAMRFTREVNWTASDFLVFGMMLVLAGGAFELAVRVRGDRIYRAAAGLAILTGFLLVWATLAVGFIGDEGDPANLAFGGLLLAGIAGAAAVRLRAGGTARVLAVLALGQAAIGVIAGLAGYAVWLPTLLFVALWLGSAWLFRKASRAG